MRQDQKASAKVIVVEDSDEDCFLLNRAMAMVDAGLVLTRARDGVEAVQILESSTNCSDPLDLLLDLRLPASSGFELLAWVTSHPKLRNTPVVMFNERIGEQHRRTYIQLELLRETPAPLNRFRVTRRNQRGVHGALPRQPSSGL